MENLKEIILKYTESINNKSLSSYRCKIKLDDKNILITIPFFLSDEFKNIYKLDLEKILNKEFNDNFTVNFQTKIVSHKVQSSQKGIPNIKNIILISSGKGGVGKSTTCTNLAFSLKNLGAKVGILDADIYGPSQAMLLDAYKKLELKENKFIPNISNEVKMVSIANLIDDSQAVIWRGTMASKAILQLLNQTHWGELDYLLIDLPPGTGDIQITIAKSIPVSGSIVVTTPQDLALIDVKRAIAMFEKVGISILGVIENMSFYLCPKCGNKDYIFGEMKKNYAENFNILGNLPLDINIRKSADSGKSIVLEENQISKIYENLALKVILELALKPKNLNAKIPSVKVVN